MIPSYALGLWPYNEKQKTGLTTKPALTCVNYLLAVFFVDYFLTIDIGLFFSTFPKNKELLKYLPLSYISFAYCILFFCKLQVRLITF